LNDEALAEITRLKLGSVAKRLQSSHGAKLEYGQNVLDHITAQCKDPDSGGRMIDNIITNSVLPELSRLVLERMVSGEEISRVEIDVKDDNFEYALGAVE